MQWKPVFGFHFSFLVESGPGCSFKDSTLFSMSSFQPKLQRKSEAMHNQQAWEQSLQTRDYRRSNIDQLPCVSFAMLPVCVSTSPSLFFCSGHVLPRCSAMLGATGPSLQVLIVFWSAGWSIAFIPLPQRQWWSLWVMRSWFIIWHTVRARWCISKKFTKASLIFI